MTSAPPTVFISYSQDDDFHCEWVLRLAEDLRARGINAVLDQWDLAAGQDLATFMEEGVRGADRVVLVCTDAYVRKANDGLGGVGYEKMIISKEVVDRVSTMKFVPITRRNAERSTPACLGSRKYVDFNEDAEYADRLEQLCRAIHEAPLRVKPPLGANPYTESTSASTTAQTDVPSRDVLADPWFHQQRLLGMPKVAKCANGSMEVAFGCRAWTPNFDPPRLLEAARSAEIHTFGWPIGVVVDVPEGRPRPATFGISAAVEHTGFSDIPLFDYWALRRNTDFYLIQNLFEDRREPAVIYFNTRIVRVAESLMYARNLHLALGCPVGEKIAFRVWHAGIAERTLSSSNPGRILSPFPRVCHEAEVETHGVFKHPLSNDDIVKVTRNLLQPMFQLFDFFELTDPVYEEIVTSFLNGRVT